MPATGGLGGDPINTDIGPKALSRISLTATHAYQNACDGLLFVIENQRLHKSISTLIGGETAPTN
jgi:hypothetical protein